jgi:asparagine synthase (glutamine-hydrolysing)
MLERLRSPGEGGGRGDGEGYGDGNGGGNGKGVLKCFGAGGFGAKASPSSTSGLAESQERGNGSALAFHGKICNPLDFMARDERPENLPRALLDRHVRGGMGFLSAVRGDYVLAIWDGARSSLHLATDPFRVCPLYYTNDSKAFIFASSIDAIRACPHAGELSIEAEAVVDFFAFEVIPTPRTIFREIRKLPAGSTLSLAGGKVEIKPHWQIDFTAASRERESVLAERVRAGFQSAVSLRVAGEEDSGAIGSFLSGGLDSSTLVGVLGQVLGRPVKAFTIGFAETPFNEMSYARIAAKAFAAEHHEYFVTPEDTLSALPVLARTYGEPYGNSSAIPTYYCARLAGDHGVKVMYAGDGGDELFAGNKRYGDQALFERYQQLPGLVKTPLERTVNFLASSVGLGLFVKARKFIRRANVPYPGRLSFYGLYELMPPGELFSPDFLGRLAADYNPYSLYQRLFSEARADSNLDSHLHLDHRLTLEDNDLPKVTGMAGAAGLAVRFPFLDRQFADIAAAVPASIKMKGTKLRTFYKKAYRDFLPREILQKKKHGFGLPIAGWLRTHGPLNELMRDLVLSRRSLERGYFRRETLERLVGLHERDSTTFYGTILWYLMTLELWHREHLDGKGNGSIAGPNMERRQVSDVESASPR